VVKTAYIAAVADTSCAHSGTGTAVVGSYQTSPQTGRRYKVRGVAHTPKMARQVEVALTHDEARKLVQDWISFGLFGRHGRIVTSPKARS
jgi:hypothetical protein